MEIVDYMAAHYPPDFKYQQFGAELTAHFFNATYWAELVAASGAKYFVLTSKHHDGFSNWPSSRNFGWNSRDIGQKRDVVGELAGGLTGCLVDVGRDINLECFRGFQGGGQGSLWFVSLSFRVVPSSVLER